MKNLVVCLDGTWNDEDSETPLTNIGRIARLVDPKPEHGPQQRIYYDSGVGTKGWLRRYIEGGLGIGLSANVQKAYRFLSQFYEPGDGIYVFGFSRGAFSARSLCGFIGASGLLKREACNRANMDSAWDYYRTPPKERYPADNARLRQLVHSGLKVRFLGVFDTVGALGIPRKRLNWIGRQRFNFHDTELSSVVEHSCHALAIDEKRIEFEPAVWVRPRHRNWLSVEQVWFPGVHADIGGGYEKADLSSLALSWMLSRLAHHCENEVALRTDVPPIDQGDPMGHMHESRSRLYRRSWKTPMMRQIAQIPVEPPGDFVLSQCPPHSEPINEHVHWSAMVRWKKGANGPEGPPGSYAPPNLGAVMSRIERGELLVVGPDGEPEPWPGLQLKLTSPPSGARSPRAGKQRRKAPVTDR
jgi:hypothetical protein